MVELEVRTTSADELNEAGRSRNISKAAALFNRSNRTPFHLPKCFGGDRQVMMQRFQKTADRYDPWRCVAANDAPDTATAASPIEFRLDIADAPYQSAVH